MVRALHNLSFALLTKELFVFYFEAVSNKTEDNLTKLLAYVP